MRPELQRGRLRRAEAAAPVAEEDDLEALIRRAQSGDRDAWGDIVRRYGERVRDAIHGRLGRDLRARLDTEDVFQSTIAASIEDLSAVRWEGEERFVGWLAQVARRRLVDAARRHRYGARDVARERPIDAAAGAAAHLTSPTQSAVRAEAAQDVRKAIERLPEAERRVVELRAFEGLGFLDIAARLRLPDRHVARNTFERALKRMGDLLDGDAPGGPS